MRGLADAWPARRWAACASPSADGQAAGAGTRLHPAFGELQRLYAAHTVPLVQPGAAAGATTAESRRTVALPEAVRQLEHGQRAYIKDWHLVQQLRPHESAPYTTPGVFADDCAWQRHMGRPGARFCCG